jgi:hypothetical protein
MLFRNLLIGNTFTESPKVISNFFNVAHLFDSVQFGLRHARISILYLCVSHMLLPILIIRILISIMPIEIEFQHTV